VYLFTLVDTEGREIETPRRNEGAFFNQSKSWAQLSFILWTRVFYFICL